MIVGSARFLPDEFAPARARRFVASRCQQLPRDAQVAVLLLTSELVTNAVFHGRGEVRLDLHIDERLVGVGVADSGGGNVAIAEEYRWPEGGHGLRVVDALSDRWGVESMPDSPGKRVWFELPVVAPGERGTSPEQDDEPASGLPSQPAYESSRGAEPALHVDAPGVPVADSCPVSNGGTKPPGQGT